MQVAKTILLFQTLVVALIACTNPGSGDKTADTAQSKAAAVDTSKKSLPAETSKQVGSAQVTIKYYAPAVRGRVIWGGLVAYDNVWVTGAHKATSLEVSKDFMIGDKKITAGKFAIFTIPAKDEWTLIINRNWDQHLADEYSEKEDVLRMKVKPVALNETVERLRYDIEQAAENLANVSMSWEKLQLAFAIKIVD